MVCIYCQNQMCFMCGHPTDDDSCCCAGTFGIVKLLDDIPHKKSYLSGRRIIEDGTDMKDPVAVGRDRALHVAPIPKDYICEWEGLLFAGGGVVPIIGCTGNPAHHRHHGPDKGTLNNAVGTNLHRVCTACHNRWHELNDSFYGERPRNNLNYFPTEGYKEHDRNTKATPKQILANHIWWDRDRGDRVPYREIQTNDGDDLSEVSNIE